MPRDACDLAPVGTFRVRIEQTQIRDKVTSGAAVSKRIPSMAGQSSGSILTMEAPSLLPTQKLTGVVELSTKTRRILVERGSR
jgi:hypothetical protein